MDIATLSIINKKLNSPVVSNKTLTNMAMTHINKGTVSSGIVTFSLKDANTQRLQVGGPLEIKVSNWAVVGKLQDLTIELVNGGSASLTWPTINWVKPNGTTTTTFSLNGIKLQAAGTDWVLLWTSNAGVTIYGKIVR